MKKEQLKTLIEAYGDAEVSYRSLNSNKLKYNVVTLDFNNKHIQEKSNRAVEDKNTLLVFAWDTDSYRLLKPSLVIMVRPLSDILKNK